MVPSPKVPGKVNRVPGGTVPTGAPTVALPFFGELATETENALAEHGYRLLLCNSFGRADREREYLDLLAGNRVGGIISGAHNDPLDDYATLRLPLVTIDRELAPNIPNVRAANEQGGRLATEPVAVPQAAGSGQYADLDH